MTIEELNDKKELNFTIKGWHISAIKFWLDILPTSSNAREIQIKSVRTGQCMTGAMTNYDNEIESVRELFNEILEKYEKRNN